MFANHLKYKIRDVDPSDRKNRCRKTVLLPINTQPDISEEDLYEMQVLNRYLFIKENLEFDTLFFCF